MITAEELVQETEPQEVESDFKLGTVSDLFENGTAKIQFDGEETPSEKQYAYLSSYTPAKDDRVLLGATGGTYIILGKVNYNVGPDVEEEIDRYLFDVKQVIMRKGLSITGGTDIDGNLSVTGSTNVNGALTAGGVSSTGDITTSGAVNSNSVDTSSVSAGSVSANSATFGSTSIYNDRLDTRYLDASRVRTSTLNHTGTEIAFFGHNLVQQKSVPKLGTSAEWEDGRKKINEILTALHDYGLFYSR